MDIPNIRTVIHFGATSNDRGMYIKGVGMAGRDGKNAIAIIILPEREERNMFILY